MKDWKSIIDKVRVDARDMTAAELSAKYNSTPQVFRGLAKHYKFTIKRSIDMPFPMEDWHTELIKISRTKTVRELAAHFGKTLRSISHLVWRHRLPYKKFDKRERRTKSQSTEVTLQVLSMIRAYPEASYASIGATLNVSRERVSQIAFSGREHGFLPNDGIFTKEIKEPKSA